MLPVTGPMSELGATVHEAVTLGTPTRFLRWPWHGSPLKKIAAIFQISQTVPVASVDRQVLPIYRPLGRPIFDIQRLGSSFSLGTGRCYLVFYGSGQPIIGERRLSFWHL